MTVVQQIASREPTPTKEAQEVIKDLSSEGLSLEARLGIREAELKQVPSRKRPWKSSRKVVSTSRFATQKQRQGKGKAKAANPAAAKGKRRARRDEDVTEAQDGEVEREVDYLMRGLDSVMEVEEEAEEVEEDIPLAESSENAVRRAQRRAGRKERL
ncbi:hypothetical protein FN846DRAFT_888294 [Sphaerosporella brunnea]|uniref:Uncharacterized protein n=1 Tax=Sphaerosporella brunnea TaxID=1250544 RepID=A0A5J5F2X7_9PEZI|nr:hypothetical protein FN846DRAFT_888294 [Sphaerosporella brunnea]